jgi:hypothetical protein
MFLFTDVTCVDTMILGVKDNTLAGQVWQNS